MAKSKVDAKEFMLQYGDRIGVGIAGLLALLFIVFAITGTTGGISADQVRDSSKKADEAIKRSEVVPDKIALMDEPTVKPLSRIDELSKALTIPISLDQLQLTYRFFEQDILRGKFKANPNVMQPIEIVALPLVGAFRLYELRVVNNKEEVMVLKTREGRAAPKLPNGNNNLNRGSGQNMLGGPAGGRGALGGGMGGGLGGGGMAGGALGGGGLGGGGMAGGALGGGSGGMGGSRGKFGSSGQPPSDKKPVVTGNPGGDESVFTFDWRADKDVKDADILGVTIRPLRSAYIAATYPHGKQTEEIAKKLQIQKHEVERLYRKLDVQRRRIYTKGSMLPDGRIAEKELIEVDNPRDRSKKEYKSLEDIEKLTANLDDQMSPLEKDALAGWSSVNMANVAAVMTSAYSVSRYNNEPYHVEKEPLIEGLVEYAGPRLAMRLPKLVRNDYPDIMSKLPELMAAVKKIKEDEKSKIPTPPRDSRLGSGSKGDDPFDQLSGESSGEKKDGERNRGNEAPELTGPIPEYVPIRFIDVDLPADMVGGATYEYRLRVVLTNPNYKQVKDVAAPEFAKDEFLFGNWSPTTRVSFEPDSIIYAGERDRSKGATDDREKDKVPVQLHKWLGKIETLGGADRDYAIVGDWWVEKMLIGRGEYIGRSPDLNPPASESNLVQWIAHAYDTVQQRIGADVQKKTRTTDLYTNNILVDFHGGAFNSFRSVITGSNRREDVPAELLILEPDGKLVARHVSDDRNNTYRKNRYDQWKNWIDKLGKPSERKQQTNLGGSGPGSGNN